MANFTEADATQPTNPNEIPRIPKDLKLNSGDDTFSISSSGQYMVVGGKGVNTLKIDYSKITVNYGIRNTSEQPNNPAFTNEARSGSFYTSEKPLTRESKENFVQFSGIHKFNITGTKFDDHIRGAEYKDTLIGGAGDDILYAYPGEGDILDGGEGTDLLAADYSLKADRTPETTDQKISNTGTSRLPNGTTITGIEVFSIKTGRGNDTITLTGSFNDTINTNFGKDIINAGEGHDKVDGGADKDTLVVDYSNAKDGIRSSHSLSTGTGTIYTLPKGLKNDVKNSINSVTYSSIEQLNVTGTSLADELSSGKFSDILNGGAGNDTLYAYPGEADILNGGADIDVLKIEFGSEAKDVKVETTASGSGKLSNGTTYEQIEILNATTGKGNDYISWLGDGNDVIKTNGGKDTIVSGGGNDWLESGADADIIKSGGGNDWILAGGGEDIINAVNNVNFGKGELDYVRLGEGGDDKVRDIVYLGDPKNNTVYYLGGTPSNLSPKPNSTDVTLEQILEIMPRAKREWVEPYVKPLNEAMKEFGIDTKKEQAAFLGQIAVETGQFEKMTEKVTTSPKYGRYLGRGPLQLTWADTYANVGYLLDLWENKSQADFENQLKNGRYKHKDKNHKVTLKPDAGFYEKLLYAQPEKVASDPVIGSRASAMFFTYLKKCIEPAGKGDFDEVSKLVQGGTAKIGERKEFSNRALNVLQASDWAYDIDHAVIDFYTPKKDIFVVAGSRNDYILSTTPIVGSLSNWDASQQARARGSVSIVYDHNHNKVADSGDDVIAVVLGTGSVVGKDNTSIINLLSNSIVDQSGFAALNIPNLADSSL